MFSLSPKFGPRPMWYFITAELDHVHSYGNKLTTRNSAQHVSRKMRLLTLDWPDRLWTETSGALERRWNDQKISPLSSLPHQCWPAPRLCLAISPIKSPKWKKLPKFIVCTLPMHIFFILPKYRQNILKQRVVVFLTQQNQMLFPNSFSKSIFYFCFSPLSFDNYTLKCVSIHKL